MMKYRSFRWLVPIGLLLMVLSVPGASPAVVESLLVMGADAEVSCEDAKEWLTSGESNRERRQRRDDSGWTRICKSTFVQAVDGGVPMRTTGHFGHRLANGLMAPIRC